MRSIVRSTLRNLIATAIPSATVLKYRKADPKGVSPLIMVCSGGTNRPRATLKGSFPVHTIRIYSLVLHSDPGTGWTEELAEDLLDAHEEVISQVLDDNQKVEGVWQRISYTDASEAERVQIGGVSYLLEVMLLDVQEFK
jgi:hypothetical protein